MPNDFELYLLVSAVKAILFKAGRQQTAIKRNKPYHINVASCLLYDGLDSPDAVCHVATGRCPPAESLNLCDFAFQCRKGSVQVRH